MLRSTAFLALVALLAAPAAAQRTGVNVLLNTPADAAALAQLASVSQVLDVIPEIRAVIVKARVADLPAIRSFACVAAADPDVEFGLDSAVEITSEHFAEGLSHWCLDDVDVTDVSGGRAVSYDGSGVYVAVIDSGLSHNWREYFPEARISSEHARAFGGGAGEPGTVSEQPSKWGRDTFGHGTLVTSALLGFSYYGTQEFNGVAPLSTIIPVRVINQHNYVAYSTLTRAIVYVANLKASGALGGAPLVINLSLGSLSADAANRAAIDYAIAQGVVVVVSAGNAGGLGMHYPGAYPEVISVGASGWVRQFPADDPTGIDWMLRDVPEDDPLEHFVPDFSSRELAGQDLDVLAPGFGVPAAYTSAGQVDYTFWGGTSSSAPHVAGVAALMLQKNPGLAQAQIEAILESSALPTGAGCRSVVLPFPGPGNEPTWGDQANLEFVPSTVCWDADATGHGLLRAAAALDATPFP